MINPKSFIVGSGKAVKIRALTKMIPAEKVKQELKNFCEHVCSNYSTMDVGI